MTKRAGCFQASCMRREIFGFCMLASGAVGLLLGCSDGASDLGNVTSAASGDGCPPDNSPLPWPIPDASPGPDTAPIPDASPGPHPWPISDASPGPHPWPISDASPGPHPWPISDASAIPDADPGHMP